MSDHHLPIIDAQFTVLDDRTRHTRLSRIIKRAWQPLLSSLATLIGTLAIQSWSIPSWLTWQFAAFEIVASTSLLVVLLAYRDVNRRRNLAQKKLGYRRQFTTRGNYFNRR